MTAARAPAPSIGMVIHANEDDVGPFRIDLILGVWTRIGRAIEALRAIGVSGVTAEEMHVALAALLADGRTLTSDDRITKALRLLAAQDGMHAGDWLRMRYADEQMPRRKPPASVDLQIRLKGVSCSFLSVKTIAAKEPGGVDLYRVTIRTVRGDVASCEDASFANALDGAIKLAGANVEGEKR